MTRLASLPQPYVEDRVPTAREVEIAGIRARLSLCAAMLTQERARVEATIIAIERELERLKEVR